MLLAYSRLILPSTLAPKNSTKKDIIGAGIVGLLLAVFFLIIAYTTITVVSPDNRPQPYYWLSLVIFPVASMAALFVMNDLKRKFGRKAQVLYQFYKFVLIGGLNTLIDTSIYNAFISATGKTQGDEILLFKGVAFSVAVVNSYFWNKFWTFERVKGNGGEFLQFLIISLGGLGISLGTVHIIVNILHPPAGMGLTFLESQLVWANVGQLAAVCFSTIWNFIGYKYIVFSKNSSKQKAQS